MYFYLKKPPLFLLAEVVSLVFGNKVKTIKLFNHVYSKNNNFKNYCTFFYVAIPFFKKSITFQSSSKHLLLFM